LPSAALSLHDALPISFVVAISISLLSGSPEGVEDLHRPTDLRPRALRVVLLVVELERPGARPWAIHREEATPLGERAARRLGRADRKSTRLNSITVRS